jgi:hypothetical protein
MGYYGIYDSGCVLWLQKQVLLMEVTLCNGGSMTIGSWNDGTSISTGASFTPKPPLAPSIIVHAHGFNEHSTKRKRVKEPDASLLTHVRGKPYFDDGNIVLSVKNTHFRVYRATVAFWRLYLQSFGQLPQPSKGEILVDGHPVVELDDSVEDWRTILSTIFLLPHKPSNGCHTNSQRPLRSSMSWITIQGFMNACRTRMKFSPS